MVSENRGRKLSAIASLRPRIKAPHNSGHAIPAFVADREAARA